MKFEVVMKIEELTNIPVVNATTVVRWKVKGGGSASGVTERYDQFLRLLLRHSPCCCAL